MKTECVYFVLDKAQNAVKIGFTTNLKKRLATIQAHTVSELCCIKTIENATPDRERELHCKFHKQHILGEWFRMDDGLLEYLQPSLSDIESHVILSSTRNLVIEKTNNNNGRLGNVVGMLGTKPQPHNLVHYEHPGRPRLPYYSELTASQSKKEGGMASHKADLRELKRRFEERSSLAINQKGERG